MLDAIDALLERPKSSRFAWTRRDQWHVTLQFYGRVDDPDGAERGDPGRGRRVGRRRSSVVRGGGAFPSPKKAQVFWLGVDGTDALIDLHATVAAATRDFIDRRDRIALKPHLTLARLKRSVDLTADVEALAGVPVGPPWTLTELLLLESDTKPSGAVYTEHARFPSAADHLPRPTASRCAEAPRRLGSASTSRIDAQQHVAPVGIVEPVRRRRRGTTRDLRIASSASHARPASVSSRWHLVGMVEVRGGEPTRSALRILVPSRARGRARQRLGTPGRRGSGGANRRVPDANREIAAARTSPSVHTTRADSRNAATRSSRSTRWYSGPSRSTASNDASANGSRARVAEPHVRHARGRAPASTCSGNGVEQHDLVARPHQRHRVDAGATADVQDPRPVAAGGSRAQQLLGAEELEPVGLEPGVLAPLVVVRPAPTDRARIPAPSPSVSWLAARPRRDLRCRVVGRERVSCACASRRYGAALDHLLERGERRLRGAVVAHEPVAVLDGRCRRPVSRAVYQSSGPVKDQLFQMS